MADGRPETSDTLIYSVIITLPPVLAFALLGIFFSADILPIRIRESFDWGQLKVPGNSFLEGLLHENLLDNIWDQAGYSKYPVELWLVSTCPD